QHGADGRGVRCDKIANAADGQHWRRGTRGARPETRDCRDAPANAPEHCNRDDSRRDERCASPPAPARRGRRSCPYRSMWCRRRADRVPRLNNVLPRLMLPNPLERLLKRPTRLLLELTTEVVRVRLTMRECGTAVAEGG